MTITITIPIWLPIGYLALGLVLWLPLEYLAYKSIHNPGPFWKGLWRGLRKRPWVPLFMILAWPLALWEEIT